MTRRLAAAVLLAFVAVLSVLWAVTPKYDPILRRLRDYEATSIAGAHWFTYSFTIPNDSGIGKPTFGGGGLDDMWTAGHYTNASDLTYKVRIAAEGAPDTIDWSDDNGVGWDVSGANITAGYMALNNGVQIKFNATTGHTAAANWTFNCTADDDDPLHFQVMIDDTSTFASPIVDWDSRDAGDGGDGQTGCRYFNGTAWVAWPAGVGVVAAYEGQTGSYSVQSTAILTNAIYYVRYRFWDGTAWGDWTGDMRSW